MDAIITVSVLSAIVGIGFAIFFANKLSLSSLLNSKNNEMFYPNIR